MTTSERPAATVQRIVEWADTDAAGHHHNTAITRWVEAAEAQLMRERNVPGYAAVAPRVQQTQNYRGKLRFGQPITATVWIEQVGTSSLTLGFTVEGHPCNESPGGLAADGTLTTVHVPAGSHKAAPWPPAMRAAFHGTPA